MSETFRAVERALEKNGRLPSISKAWLAGLLLGGLVGLLVLVPVSGQSGSEALSINISAASSDPMPFGMTYSHVLVVSWKVAGGAAPYRLTIKVTGPDGVAAVEDEEALEGTRRFELAYRDGGTVLVSVEVEDGAGSTASGVTSVSLVPSLSTGVNVGLLSCSKMAFSTEEDFVTFGPTPPDGNPIISDGDLLGPGCVVCARNRDLLQPFDVNEDLGLDAVDILFWDQFLLAFSTELDSPHGNFRAGDLLISNGAVLPNSALLSAFGLAWLDLGLDAVHFVGETESIVAFAADALKMGPAHWVQPNTLQAALREYRIDIWFSTEGTERIPGRPAFLDGDLLSARDGIIVASNRILLPNTVPAGIPQRGVDFGLDAITGDRQGNREHIHFSTEILYQGELAFTDGDVLKISNGVVWTNTDLVLCFEAKALDLGLDALYVELR